MIIVLYPIEGLFREWINDAIVAAAESCEQTQQAGLMNGVHDEVQQRDRKKFPEQTPNNATLLNAQLHERIRGFRVLGAIQSCTSYRRAEKKTRGSVCRSCLVTTGEAERVIMTRWDGQKTKAPSS